MFTYATCVQQQSGQQREQGDCSQNEGGSGPWPSDLLPHLNQEQGSHQPIDRGAIGGQLQQHQASRFPVQKQQWRSQAQGHHAIVFCPEKMGCRQRCGDDEKNNAKSHAIPRKGISRIKMDTFKKA